MARKLKSWFLRRIKSLNPEVVAIVLFLIIALLRGVIWATTIPPWQTNDEYDYYARIETAAVARGGGFYSLFPAVGHLFYTLIFDWSFPHKIYFFRFFSVILGCITVFLGYKIAKELFPDRKFFIFGVPLFISFWPMISQHSIAIAPDNFAKVGVSLFLYYSVKLINRGFRLFDSIGSLTGLLIGVFSKRIAFFSLPLAALLPIFVVFRKKAGSKREITQRKIFLTAWVSAILGSLLMLPLISQMLTGVTIDPQLVSKAFSPSTLIQSFRIEYPGIPKMFIRTFTGGFAVGAPTAFKAWLPDAYSDIVVRLILITLAGLLIFFLRNLFEKDKLEKPTIRIQSLALLFLLLSVVFAILEVTLSAVLGSGLPHLQARWIFPAALAMGVLFLAGISLPFRDFSKQRDNSFLLTLAGNLFFFDSLAIFYYIIPYFYLRYPNEYNMNNLMAGVPYSSWLALSGKPFLFNQSWFAYIIFGVYWVLFFYWCYYIATKVSLFRK